MKNLVQLILILTLVISITSTVSADGESSGSGFKKITKEICTTTYNGVVECREETTQQEIVREEKEVLEEFQDEGLPETGIAEMAMIASVLFGGGLVFLIMAQKQLKA